MKSLASAGEFLYGLCSPGDPVSLSSASHSCGLSYGLCSPGESWSPRGPFLTVGDSESRYKQRAWLALVCPHIASAILVTLVTSTLRVLPRRHGDVAGYISK